MFYTRTTKTASGSTAVQVVRYENRKKIIIKHFGSAHSMADLQSLLAIAEKWIEITNKQLSFFPKTSLAQSSLLALDKCEYLGVKQNYVYEILTLLLKLNM